MTKTFDDVMSEAIESASKIVEYEKKIWGILGSARYLNAERKVMHLKGCGLGSFTVKPGIISYIDSVNELSIEIKWQDMESLAYQMLAKASELRELKNREKNHAA